MNTKQERIAMFRDAVGFRKPERIPMFANNSTWHLIDEGIPFGEAMHDWNVMFEACCNYIERYQFDCYKSPGGRNPLRINEALDANYYIVQDENLNIEDKTIIGKDDYDEFLADPDRYIWEKALPSKAPGLKSPDAVEKFRKAAVELMDFMEYTNRMNRAMYEAYEVPKEARFSVNTRSGLNPIMMFYRGLKQTALDLRRNYSQLKEHCRRLEEGRLEQIEALCQDDSPNIDAAFDFSSGMNEQSILNIRQFEDLVWPFYGKYFSILAKYKKTTTFTVQSDMLRFSDYFSEVPKGVVAMGYETDDPYEIREKLPNICIMGGMTTTYLADRTPEECVSYGKRLIDDLGTEGGFIMSSSKILTYRNDCKRENQLALNEFVRSYKLR